MRHNREIFDHFPIAVNLVSIDKPFVPSEQIKCLKPVKVQWGKGRSSRAAWNLQRLYNRKNYECKPVCRRYLRFKLLHRNWQLLREFSKFYDRLCSTLCCEEQKKYKIVTGCNEHCKVKYKEARVALIESVHEGKTNFCSAYQKMMETRE